MFKEDKKSPQYNSFRLKSKITVKELILMYPKCLVVDKSKKNYNLKNKYFIYIADVLKNYFLRAF